MLSIAYWWPGQHDSCPFTCDGLISSTLFEVGSIIYTGTGKKQQMDMQLAHMGKHLEGFKSFS